MNNFDEKLQKDAAEMAAAGVGQSEIETYITMARAERDAGVQETVAETQPSQLATDASYLAKTGGEMAARGAAIAAGQGMGLRAPGMLKALAVPAGGAISAGMADVALQRMGGQPYRLGQTMQEMAVGTLPGISAMPGGVATARLGVQEAPKILKSLMSPQGIATAAKFYSQRAAENIQQEVPKVLEFFMSPQGLRTLSTLYTGKAAATMIDEGRAPTAGETAMSIAGTAVAGKTAQIPRTAKQMEEAKRMANDAVTNTNAREWLAKGGRIDPTLTYRDSAINRTVSAAAGGSSQIQRSANEVNQRVVNDMARADIGLAESLPLTKLNIQDQITRISQSFRDIENLGTSFKDQMNSVRRAREAASEAWREYTAGAAKGKPDTDARNAAKKLTEEAVKVEDALEDMLTKSGNSDLLKQYVNDRRRIARAYAYKDALIEGNISPGIISDQKSIQKRFSDGNLDLIARVHDSMPKVMRDITDVQPVVQNIPLMLQRAGAAGLLATGAVKGGASPGLAAAAGLAGAATPEMARAAMLSPFYQRVMSAPRYGVEDPAFAASVARFAGTRALSQ